MSIHRRTRASNLHLATMTQEDARLRAPGLRGGSDNHWVEGNGAAPLGWEPWDYEQSLGYRRIHVGESEIAWGYNSLWTQWTLEECGLHPFDYSDEEEDELTGTSPPRHCYDRDWDFEGDPVPFPHIKMDRTLESDPVVQAYDDDRKTRAKEQRQADEDTERRKSINTERRNITAMKRAAREKMLDKVAAGYEGEAEVRVRKDHQTLTWKYTVRDGKAHIHFKGTGWVTLQERRQ